MEAALKALANREMGYKKQQTSLVSPKQHQSVDIKMEISSLRAHQNHLVTTRFFFQEILRQNLCGMSWLYNRWCLVWLLWTSTTWHISWLHGIISNIHSRMILLEETDWEVFFHDIKSFLFVSLKQLLLQEHMVLISQLPTGFLTFCKLWWTNTVFHLIKSTMLMRLV